jgi:copper(I)-binding protein
MKNKIIWLLFITTMIVLTSGCSAGELKVTDAWARKMSQGQNSAVYYILNNSTPTDDVLLGALTTVASNAEVHKSVMNDQGVMSMQPQETVTVPSKGRVVFEPGGLHLMLFDLRKDLKIGDTFPLTFVFEDAGNMTIHVGVKEQE